jgi:hypothetical protein
VKVSGLPSREGLGTVGLGKRGEQQALKIVMHAPSLQDFGIILYSLENHHVLPLHIPLLLLDTMWHFGH